MIKYLFLRVLCLAVVHTLINNAIFQCLDVKESILVVVHSKHLRDLRLQAAPGTFVLANGISFHSDQLLRHTLSPLADMTHDY